MNNLKSDQNPKLFGEVRDSNKRWVAACGRTGAKFSSTFEPVTNSDMGKNIKFHKIQQAPVTTEAKVWGVHIR